MSTTAADEEKMVKIYQLNDCDWWVGESLGACKADYIATTGDQSCMDDDAASWWMTSSIG